MIEATKEKKREKTEDMREKKIRVLWDYIECEEDRE